MRNLTKKELAKLIASFQDSTGELSVDGKFGPKTLRSLNETTDCRLMRAFITACSDNGQKEEPLGSNAGPYVESLREDTGLDRLAGGEWCAVFVSKHLIAQGINVKSRSAKTLVDRVGTYGRVLEVEDLKEFTTGLTLHRRGKNRYHVRMFRTLHRIGHWEGREYFSVRWVGGNEQHRVRIGKEEDSHLPYFSDVVKIVTI